MNKELEIIIQNRQFKDEDTEKWGSILAEIPSYLDKVIEQEYSSTLDTIIKDPLDSNCKETLQSFTKRLTKHLFYNFDSYPPFTIVRLSEILNSPKKHYNKPEKFLRALENVIQVSSSIADFPQPSFDDVKLNGDEGESVKVNGDVVPVTVGSGDSQTIFLTKIPWLTEEDIKEIESEHYLADEYPLGEAPLNEQYDHEERPLENEQKKRTLEEQKDSPEKKHKPDEDQHNHGHEGTEDFNDTETEEPVNNENKAEEEIPNETNEKTDQNHKKSEQNESDLPSIRDSETFNDAAQKEESTNREAKDGSKEEHNDPKEELKSALEDPKEDIKEHSKEDSKEDISITSEADETLDEDKMDINTTLEDDQMDVD